MPDIDLLKDFTGRNYLGSMFATLGNIDNCSNSIYINIRLSIQAQPGLAPGSKVYARLASGVGPLGSSCA